ncbi:hypothetical protein [Corynebacterium xerosis]|uniref:hypothetical protein n=1 Tax=Corynebacterium xerosis TaxID=1725 RepID=UPI0009E6B91A|nr:hypothetical protein [Corynebacterium xerosis]SQB96528.1 Uncharacterised protein [Clostridium paraputrificum]
MVDPEKDAEKSVDEVFDAEPVELGADVPETGQADQSINDLIGEQNREAEEFAKSFLKTVLRLRGVRIEREQFLRSELHKRGIAREVIDEAIALSPAAAGIDVVLLDDMANAAIAFETRKSSALSFAAGLPGGFGLLATVPGDVTQFYVHAFRVMQKTAYVYGWQSFLEDSKEVDDETLGKLSMFLGVMLGVGGASSSLTVFAASVARPAIQKQVAGKALTKTTWYPVMKSTLRVIGVKLTKDSLAKTVTKVVPVAGGVISGGMTFVTLRGQSKRLMEHLRELPPPNVDAAEWRALVTHADAEEALRDNSVLSSVGGAVSNATETASTEARAALDGAGSAVKGAASGAGSAVRGAASGAGSAVKGAASGASGRLKSLVRRKNRDLDEAGVDDDDQVDSAT